MNATAHDSSTLTKHQQQTFGPCEYTGGGTRYRITATVRFDDRCGNRHNSFSITGEIDRLNRTQWVEDRGGRIHAEIVKHFPHLAPYIKWHLCGTNVPMHYIANTVYHVQQSRLDYARSTAVWPEATDDDLTAPGLEKRLTDRLPGLLADFRAAVESLGFTW